MSTYITAWLLISGNSQLEVSNTLELHTVLSAASLRQHGGNEAKQSEALKPRCWQKTPVTTSARRQRRSRRQGFTTGSQHAKTCSTNQLIHLIYCHPLGSFGIPPLAATSASALMPWSTAMMKVARQSSWNKANGGQADHINTRILQTMVSGIPPVLASLEPKGRILMFMWSVRGPYQSLSCGSSSIEHCKIPLLLLLLLSGYG